MKRIVVVFFAALVFVFSSAQLWATEGGGGAYSNGGDDFMMAAFPPPGTYFFNYLTYYSASKLKDGSGNNVTSDFKISATSDILTVAHVTDKKIFGANWAVKVGVSVSYMDIHYMSQRDSKFGLSDIVVGPFALGWHFNNFHLMTGLDVYIPNGEYDRNRLANISRNYWTFEPMVGATYLSNEGFEVSGKLMYDFNTKNNDTNYKSGQEFHVDYTVGYHPNKSWALGVGGYYYLQTTDDKQNGLKVGDDGNMGRVIAIGPQVSYNYEKMIFTLKYQKEFEAENRSQGEALWLNFIFGF